MSKVGLVSARRMEVFTGAGRRRDWSIDQKAAIVAESHVDGVSVSDVARRHGLTPSQLFAWRRDARQKDVPGERTEDTFFVPAVVDEAGQSVTRLRSDEPPLIGFDLGGASVWVCAGADAGVVTAIIRALKSDR